jgi:hypothetical protein
VQILTFSPLGKKLKICDDLGVEGTSCPMGKKLKTRK